MLVARPFSFARQHGLSGLARFFDATSFFLIRVCIEESLLLFPYTARCPLHPVGCYARDDRHLAVGVILRNELVDRSIAAVNRFEASCRSRRAS